jgi:hypothetical protein
MFCNKMSEILDLELEEMQHARHVHMLNIGRAKSLRLEKSNRIEPANVDKTLEQLIDDHYVQMDCDATHRVATRDLHTSM